MRMKKFGQLRPSDEVQSVGSKGVSVLLLL